MNRGYVSETRMSYQFSSRDVSLYFLSLFSSVPRAPTRPENQFARFSLKGIPCSFPRTHTRRRYINSRLLAVRSPPLRVGYKDTVGCRWNQVWYQFFFLSAFARHILTCLTSYFAERTNTPPPCPSTALPPWLPETRIVRHSETEATQIRIAVIVLSQAA